MGSALQALGDRERFAAASALLSLCLAISATAANGAGSPRAAAASTGLTAGDYRPGPAGTRAAAGNRQATLTVPRFRVSSSLGTQQAPARHAFLTVSTEWRTVGSIQYLVPQVTNHLFLLLDGDRPATLSDATAAAPHPLALDQLLVPPSGGVVAGDIVFEIPDHGVSSLELLFIDSEQGNMNVPLFGRAPPTPNPIAGPASNGLIETAILGMKENAAVGGVHAPAGRTYVLIDLRMRGLSPGNLVRLDPTMYSMLNDADGYSYRVMALDGLDDEFGAATQLLPLIPSRGTLAYLIAVPHAALTLAINLPEYRPMALALPNSGPIASGVAKSLVRFEDPDTLTLNVVGLRRAASVGTNSAATGKEYLILDLLFVSKVDQGIEFQTTEQLLLRDGQDQITVDAEAIAALPHGMTENCVLAAHGHARFQVIYQVRKAATHLTLRYRGFNADTQQPLPEVVATGRGRSQ
jgi:hypothetical protein